MKGLLLDTHVLLWWAAGDVRVPMKVRRRLAKRDGSVVVSAVTAVEIGVKVSVGKLALPGFSDPAEFFEHNLDQLNAELLPVTAEDGCGIARLPLVHRDPFDRTLISQAINHGLSIATSDEAILRYHVPVYW